MKTSRIFVIAAFGILGIASGTLTGVSAFAGKESAKVYKALDVATVVTEKTPDFVTSKKEVEGLECWEKDYSSIWQQSDYDCLVRLENRNDEGIYTALKATEVNVTPDGLLGSARFEKTVGVLTCTKSYAVVPNPTPAYRCKLN